MQREDTERLLSIAQSAADIQRFVLLQLSSGKTTISGDRRSDITSRARHIAEQVGKLS